MIYNIFKKVVYWNKNIFRFANIIKFDDNIFSVVKTVKSKTNLDLGCAYSRLSDDSMLSQVKAVEQMLKIESSEHINDTLTKKELKTAGEMFIYLIMCPDEIKPWLLFYKDLFQFQSPDQIILTLNRLMKGPRTHTNEIYKKLAEIFFNRISKMLLGRKIEKLVSDPEAQNQQQQLEGIF